MQVILTPQELFQIREALSLSKKALEHHEADKLSNSADTDAQEYVEVRAYSAVQRAISILDPEK
jgi:predicted translin family RNA/ssDNA-binding protein